MPRLDVECGNSKVTIMVKMATIGGHFQPTRALSPTIDRCNNQPQVAVYPWLMAAAPIALCQRRSDEVLLVLFCDAELQKGGKLKFVIVRSITFSHLINYLLTIILHAIVSQINKVSAGCVIYRVMFPTKIWPRKVSFTVEIAMIRDHHWAHVALSRKMKEWYSTHDDARTITEATINLVLRSGVIMGYFIRNNQKFRTQ